MMMNIFKYIFNWRENAPSSTAEARAQQMELLRRWEGPEAVGIIYRGNEPITAEERERLFPTVRGGFIDRNFKEPDDADA